MELASMTMTERWSKTQVGVQQLPEFDVIEP
jgi:hypothetical protein